VYSQDQRVAYSAGDSQIELGYRPHDGGFAFAIGGKTTQVSRFGVDGDRVWFVEHGNHRRGARVVRDRDRVYVLADGYLATLTEEPRFPDHAAQAIAGGLVAPMPGKVVKVLVTPGQEVAAGAPIVVLEAMKMEHTVRAPEAGVVGEIKVAVGDQVEDGALLGTVAPAIAP
jgi:biotin carboxyl carrier protein